MIPVKVTLQELGWECFQIGAKHEKRGQNSRARDTWRTRETMGAPNRTRACILPALLSRLLACDIICFVAVHPKQTYLPSFLWIFAFNSPQSSTFLMLHRPLSLLHCLCRNHIGRQFIVLIEKFDVQLFSWMDFRDSLFVVMFHFTITQLGLPAIGCAFFVQQGDQTLTVLVQTSFLLSPKGLLHQNQIQTVMKDAWV